MTDPDREASAESADAERGGRILALDVVRGFAAFGILMVNVQTFGGPYPLFAGEPFTDAVSQGLYALVDVFFVSKFYPIFSMLFGLGLAMQMRSAEARGEPVHRFVLRRQAALLAIGVVHAALLSTIDILVQYAVLGVLLIPLRRLAVRSLLAVAACLVATPVLLTAIFLGLGGLGSLYGETTAKELIAAYAHGSLAEVWSMRLREIRDYYVWVSVQAGWQMFGMMCVGLAIEKSGLLLTLASRRARIGRFARRSLAWGLVMAVAHAALFMAMRRMQHAPAAGYLASSVVSALGEPATALGYASGLAWLVLDPAWARRLEPFARVGRLALSSYLLQSLAMGTLAFSYGLGRYGADPPLAWVTFVVVFYGLELWIARVYLERRAVGPAEWIWRAMAGGARRKAVARDTVRR